MTLNSADASSPRAVGRSSGRQQYAALGILSVAAVTLTGLLSVSPGGTGLFEPYFGSIPPLLAMGIAAALGFVSLGYLLSQQFQIRAARTWHGVRFAAVSATIFGIWQACVDLFVKRFPRDLNVEAPRSFLFYPAMGYVVEVAFHALPLALLLFVLNRIPGRQKPNDRAMIWLCIVAVAALEPVLVHMRMGASFYVGGFVFVFTLVELDIFRRYDFVSMYAFRLVFYLWWHIAWGYVRLRWLF